MHAPSQHATPLEWRGIAAYLLIVFGVTWTLQIGALLGGIRFDGVSPTPAAFAVLLASMFVPALGAIIVRRFVTREGFGDAGLRFGPGRYYLLVWLSVPLLFLAVYALSVALGLARFEPGMDEVQAQMRAELPEMASAGQLLPPSTLLLVALLGSLTVGIVVTAVGTFGEELGWTGYLLPRLLPLGRWTAALLYGAIWGLWHAPAVWGGYNYPGHPVVGVLMMMLFTMAVALGMTALRLRSSSVLLTAWAHAAINAQARGPALLLVRDVDPILGGVLGVTGIVVLGAIGALLLHRTRERYHEEAAERRGAMRRHEARERAASGVPVR